VISAVVGFIAGFVAGASLTALALSKDRKRVDASRAELRESWVEYWKQNADLARRERDLAERSGSFQGMAS
jgi:hypothetical protein